MSWTPLRRIVKAQNAEVSVTLGRYGTGKKNPDAPIRLSIFLKAEVLQRLKNPKTLAVAAGAGDPHVGMLKLSPGNDFPVARFKRGGARVLVPRPDFLVDAAKDRCEVEYRIDGSELTFDLPAQWRAGATRRFELPANGGGAANVQQPARNVTSDLMGDPPKGRSAFDQRRSR